MQTFFYVIGRCCVGESWNALFGYLVWFREFCVLDNGSALRSCKVRLSLATDHETSPFEWLNSRLVFASGVGVWKMWWWRSGVRVSRVIPSEAQAVLTQNAEPSPVTRFVQHNRPSTATGRGLPNPVDLGPSLPRLIHPVLPALPLLQSPSPPISPAPSPLNLEQSPSAHRKLFTLPTSHHHLSITFSRSTLHISTFLCSRYCSYS